MPFIITLEQARKWRCGKYFTGKPCNHGHVAERYVASRQCVVCARTRLESWRKNNPNALATMRKCNDRWREKNREHVRQTSREWYERHREEQKQRCREYYQKNKQAFLEYNRLYRKAKKEMRARVAAAEGAAAQRAETFNNQKDLTG